MKKISILILIITVISSCQTPPYQPYARDVKKKPNQSGIIALKPNFIDDDRNKAMSMIQSNCNPGVGRIVEEGEVVIGQESTNDSSTSKSNSTSSQQVGSFLGVPIMSSGKNPSENTQSKTSTTQIKEWQISYECLNKKSAVK